jgi:drug/metabolite transporter (DMT)-like permease
MAVFLNYLRAYTGYLQILSAALIWGSYGLFVRALDFTPEYILFFRFFFGLAGLLIFNAIKGDFSWIGPARVHWKAMLLPAVLTCLSWLAYTYSISYTSVSNAAFLIYTAPVFTVIFAPVILKERLEARTVFALTFSLSGITAIMGLNSLMSVGSSLQGDLIALFGGITYGISALYLKKIPSSILGLPSNIIICAYLSLALLPFAIFSLNQFSWNGILILLGLGVFQQTFGATLFHLGLRKVKAQHAGILTYVEPLAATVLAALFLYEGITAGSILGGFLIIVGGMIIVLKRNPAPAVEMSKPSPNEI